MHSVVGSMTFDLFHVAAIWPRAVKHKEADRIPESPRSNGQVTYKWKRKWPGIHC